MRNFRCPFLLLLAFVAESAIAQMPGGDAVGGIADQGLGAGALTSMTPAPTRGPIYITGKVRTASGEKPADSVSIRRQCGMDEFVEGYTDSKGRFSFQVGGNRQFAITDAAAHTTSPTARSAVATMNAAGPDVGMGVDLSNCRLVAELPGYSSSFIQLTRRRSMDRPFVGTLILTPADGSTGELVSVTTLTAPKTARKALDKALKELNRGSQAKLHRAIRLLEKAVAEHPPYASAWAVLGETRQRMGNEEAAMDAFEHAVESDPGYLRAYLPMTEIALQRGEWHRSAELAAKALELDPSSVPLNWFYAVSLLELDRHDEALAAVDRVERELEGRPLPQTHHMRGMIYAERGDFVDAAVELRRFVAEAPDSPMKEEADRQLAEWSELGVLSPVEP